MDLNIMEELEEKEEEEEEEEEEKMMVDLRAVTMVTLNLLFRL